jgi:L-lactate dehydrogenase complex protein LldF
MGKMEHYHRALQFYRDRGEWHDATLWQIRKKRDRAVAEVENWEELRERASQIKEKVLKEWDRWIALFTERARQNGIEVYFAETAEEHNRLVYRLLEGIGAKKVVKSKSMLTEECGLNRYLEERGIEVIDTDLGERIVQLRGEPPSHIVLPAVHLKKEEVAEALGEKSSDPLHLTREMRRRMRQEFLSADAAITGANFLVAEKGWGVVCTNEGNADLGVTLTPLHIISVGIEKIVPTLEGLAPFLKMLARNATGQPITTYTTFFGSPAPGRRRAIILVDNGRRKRGKGEFWETLKCIRCSACLTTCPVFRRSGGHSYRYTIPGPIGSLLAPLVDRKGYRDLPFACTLCGSCEAVCPVKIPFSRLLVQMRGYVTTPTLLAVWAEKGLHLPTAWKLFSLILKLTPPSLLELAVREWSRYRKLPLPTGKGGNRNRERG